MMNRFNLVVEIGREAATVIMMLSVAFLVERTNRTRTFAAFVYLFGVWDVFYYIWLKVTIKWPVSWTEWDVLFHNSLGMAGSLDLSSTDCTLISYLGWMDFVVR